MLASRPADDRAFARGALVVIRDEDWSGRSAEVPAHAGTGVKAASTSELVRDQEASVLPTLDEVAPLELEGSEQACDDSPAFRTSWLYPESLLRRPSPDTAELVIGHQGVVNEACYLCVPPQRILSALRPPLLLTDGVSLGLSASELCLISVVQFPVLQGYEREILCDLLGRIVVIGDGWLPGVGLSRKEWTEIANAVPDHPEPLGRTTRFAYSNPSVTPVTARPTCARPTPSSSAARPLRRPHERRDRRP